MALTWPIPLGDFYLPSFTGSINRVVYIEYASLALTEPLCIQKAACQAR